MRIKHPGYLAVSAVLIGAGGLLLASQLMPAALASLGAGVLVGAKKGIHFGEAEVKKITQPVVKAIAAKPSKKRAVTKKPKRSRK